MQVAARHPADDPQASPGTGGVFVTDESSVVGFGRVKAPPVCLDTTLQKEAMSTETLQQWVFPVDAVVPTNSNSNNNSTTNQYHISSTCSRSSAGTTATTVTAPLVTATTTATPDKTNPTPFVVAGAVRVPVDVVSISSNHSCGDSTHATLSADEATKHSEEHLNAKVALRKTSRQGRSSQRWATSTTSPGGEGVRLTTGCVPILRTGKILFVSASRKPAWILPKGGWEQDESMEESAIRECFEEAGCLGTLGPALSPVHYETRKAKKRRMDHEHIIQQHKIAKTESNISASRLSVAAEDEVKPNGDIMVPKEEPHPSKNKEEADLTSAGAILTDQAMSRIRGTGSAGNHTDETMSVGSLASTTYSHVQMTLFPLYVRKIEATWPEAGRFRKAVDIDEAIEMLDERPELKAALQEVKKRGLHLIQQEPVQED